MIVGSWLVYFMFYLNNNNNNLYYLILYIIMSDNEIDLDKIVLNFFSDASKGLFGTAKMVSKIKSEFPQFTTKQIKQAVENLQAIQRHRQTNPKKMRKQYTRTTAIRPFASVQMDIADLPLLQTPQNRNVRYLMVVIDIFSRYLWVQPSTNRKRIYRKFELILNRMKEEFKQTPKNLVSDKEFRTKKFNKISEKFGYFHSFSIGSDKEKVSVVERSISTLKNLIKRYVEVKNTTNYVDDLQKIVENYNYTEHSTIGTDPRFAILNNLIFPPKKLLTESSKNKHNERVLKIGTKVRTRLKRTIVSKGDKPRWSKAVYQVIERIGIKFKLQNVENGEILEKLYPRHQLLVIEDVINKGKEKKKKLRHKAFDELSSDDEILDELLDENNENNEILPSKKQTKRGGKKRGKKELDENSSDEESENQQNDINMLEFNEIEPSVDTQKEKIRKKKKFERAINKEGMGDQQDKILPPNRKRKRKPNRELEEFPASVRKKDRDKLVKTIVRRDDVFCDVCERDIEVGEKVLRPKDITNEFDMCMDCVKNVKEQETIDKNLKKIKKDLKPTKPIKLKFNLKKQKITDEKMEQLNNDLRPTNPQKLKFNFSERGKRKLKRAELRNKNKQKKNTQKDNLFNLNKIEKNDLIKLDLLGI